MIDLDGRVAVVTGAGGGLGRSHALLLASRGARVVVNDLGSSRDGAGGGSEMADRVVREITEAGGRAVANHASVAEPEGARSIVEDAVAAFGGLDVVVNNAGILRDRSFAKLSLEELDLVLKVHLYGSFHVTMAAWPHLRESGRGRVVMTSSGSGLYGNFGQANYGAAKMGLVGLTRTLAIEGQRDGVLVNAIAPVAASRMTEDIMPATLLDALGPEHVSPVVAYLVSDDCRDTGRVFSVGGGYVARVAVVEGSGVTFDRPLSPEDVADAWDDIVDLGEPSEFEHGVADQTATIARALGLPLGG